MGRTGKRSRPNADYFLFSSTMSGRIDGGKINYKIHDFIGPKFVPYDNDNNIPQPPMALMCGGALNCHKRHGYVICPMSGGLVLSTNSTRRCPTTAPPHAVPFTSSQCLISTRPRGKDNKEFCCCRIICLFLTTTRTVNLGPVYYVRFLMQVAMATSFRHPMNELYGVAEKPMFLLPLVRRQSRRRREPSQPSSSSSWLLYGSRSWQGGP